MTVVRGGRCALQIGDDSSKSIFTLSYILSESIDKIKQQQSLVISGPVRHSPLSVISAVILSPPPIEVT